MREHQDRSSHIFVNASRVGRHGGLRIFTEAVIDCLADRFPIWIIEPAGVDLCNGGGSCVPAWAASGSRVSFARPILWLAYAAFFFPAGRKAKILSTTHHVLPFHGRQIVTVHDIRPFFYPDSLAQRAYFRLLLPRSLRRCDGILTVSETTKSYLCKEYSLDPSMIHVVPNQIDCKFFRPGTAPSYHDEPYLLCVGGSWKHKNVAELLSHHALWKNKYRLKIVAGPGQYLNTLRQLAKRLEVEDRVDYYCDIGRYQLLDLYQQCAALIYPSLLEGFGIPPLEAMACGRPAIVSDIPVFRELYGEVPFYVSLGDASSWRKCLAALDDYSEGRRQEGIALANTYSRRRMQDALCKALDVIWGEKIGKHS